MGGGASVQRLPDESLTKEKLNIFLGPIASGEGLQKHHNLLEVHLQQLIGPFDQERGTYIQVKLREPLLFSLKRKMLVID